MFRSLVAISFASSALAAQNVREPRLLAAPNAKLPVSLGSAASIRQLPGGRLLVNDTQRRQLLLVDPSFSTATVVADSIPNQPNSYGAKAGGLIAYRGDSTLFVDPDGLSMFVIDPSGQIARVASIPRSQDASGLGSNRAGLDAKGRIVFMGPAKVKQIVNGGLTVAQFPDSVDIDRIDLTTRKVDTVGFVKVQKQNMMITQTEKGMTVGFEVNPVQTVDDWAVLTDGSVAIVRGTDYRVDIVSSNGTKTGPKIPFAWRPLGDEEKAVVLDSAKRQVERMFSGPNAGATMAQMHGGQIPGVAPREGGQPLPFRMAPPSALPDYWPPFAQNAAKPDADGNLWIRTSAVRAGGVGGSIYDVVDREGKLIDRIQLAPGRSIAGFAKGGIVYQLVRDGAGAWLERTTTGATAAVAATDTAQFIGEWEGQYTSDHAPPGGMYMALSRSAGAWKLSIDRAVGGGIMSKTGKDVRFDGNDIYWAEELMDMPCKTAATLKDGVLTGETDCGHAKLGFTLRRKQK
jgi:hypothetical protein